MSCSLSSNSVDINLFHFQMLILFIYLICVCQFTSNILFFFLTPYWLFSETDYFLLIFSACLLLSDIWFITFTFRTWFIYLKYLIVYLFIYFTSLTWFTFCNNFKSLTLKTDTPVYALLFANILSTQTVCKHSIRLHLLNFNNSANLFPHHLPISHVYLVA